MSGKNNPCFGRTGEKNPMYKHGNCVGMNSPDKEVRSRAIKKRESTPERKRYTKLYRVKNKDNKREYDKQRNAKKKLERQGVGTLEQFMG